MFLKRFSGDLDEIILRRFTATFYRVFTTLFTALWHALSDIKSTFSFKIFTVDNMTLHEILMIICTPTHKQVHVQHFAVSSSRSTRF